MAVAREVADPRCTDPAGILSNCWARLLTSHQDFSAAIVTIDPIRFDGKTKVSNLDQLFSCSWAIIM